MNDVEIAAALPERLRPESDAEVYALGLLYASVCATSLEAAERALGLHPTGLDTGWTLTHESFRDGSPNGGVCHHAPNRRHWLFSC